MTRIWLALMHPDGRENDRLTRSPGTAELTWKALSGLKEKIPVGISIAVLKENAEQLPRLVDSIARSNPEVDRLRFNAVTGEWTAQWAQAVLEPSLWKACTRARKHKMELRMEGAFAPPPCVFTAEMVQHHVGLYGDIGRNSTMWTGPESGTRGAQRVDFGNGVPAFNRNWPREEN